MTLRKRLLLALAGSGLAIMVGAAVAREIAIRYASEAAILSSIEARMSSVDQATCEAGRDFEFLDSRPPGPNGAGERDLRPRGPFPGERPFGPGDPGGAEFRRGPRRGGPNPGEREFGRFGGQGGPRRTRVFFYDGDFSPRAPGGPAFPEAAKASLRAGETFVNGRDKGGFFGALATSWTGGPCAYALAIMPTPPPLASFTSLIIGALLLIGAPAMVLWLALAQPVARIRALASGVRDAAAGRYETSVAVTGRDEIADLGHAFNDASATVRVHLAEVERREKALRDFVAHTTHDVALPLSVLLSHVTRLRQGDVGGGAAESTVSAIAQETQYIASLLANLEAVARLESDATLHERHPVDLAALVERVAARHRAVASSTGVDFNHSVPATAAWVEGDVTLIEQAVNNLVHNAIQYNHADGHVALVLDLSGAQFTLSVTDDGPGVPASDLARLGESRFRSEEARSRRPGGTGLGLSIARDVARRHDFTLTLGHRPEGGFEAVLAGTLIRDPSAEKSSNA
ncbi:MAG: HAMP domain-containing protein [Vicinamibacteria bacterium]|nr:HAMP domain-containing protein [Vicinamibacteria bacterium]